MVDPALTDEELMRKYQSGDAVAFDALYTRHSGRIYSYLYKKLENQSEADELHQAVFLKFHLSRHRYDPRFPVLQWLYVIAKSACVDFFRKQKRAPPVQDGVMLEEIESEQGTSAPPVSQIAASPTLDALESLSPEQQQVIRWRHMDELSFQEISARLGKTEVNVRKMLSRSLTKLKATLAGGKGEVR